MRVEFSYFAAWLLPLLAGSGVWIAFNGGLRRAGDGAVAIGAGWLIGVFLAAGCARAFAHEDTAHAFAHAWPWLAGIGVVAWIAATLRMRGSKIQWRFADLLPVRWERALWWFLLILILVRFALLGDEASMRPVFPWDAWSAWSVKPKAWFLAGRMEAYVPMLEWLSYPNEALRTAGAWSYPELLAWVQLWFASAAGAWNEPLIDLAWSGALAAFALAAYGCWRAFALPAWMAIGLVYALVSLPLIDAHVALAGYADLWIAVTLGLALLSWSRWLKFRELGQWILAVALALCLPMLKLEGTVWLLSFLLVVALDLLPEQRRLRATLAGAVLVALVASGFLLFGLDVIRFVDDGVEVASVGTFGFGWHSVGGALVASLFTLPNWHLLWYLVPLLLIVRARRFRVDRSARLVGLFVLIDFALLFVLFFLTGAAAWAQDFTSANRLVLQIVPSVFVLVSLLLRDASDVAATSAPPRDTTRTRVAWTDPA